jgi:hypothetical protein
MQFPSISFITGLSLGFEFVNEMPEENIPASILIDLFVLRFIFAV